jgi:arylsulfatase A-like enzyme
MKPNVLFFFVDDQRFDTIHALGNSSILTPNLDHLLDHGTAFTQAHIPGGTSPAVCMPSRAMLLTGRTLFHLQAEGQGIPADHITLGECFQAAGYETFGTGKWHNGRAAFARSFSAGDQIFFGGMEDHWNTPVYHFDPTGRYEKQLPRVNDPFHSNQVEWRDCDHVEAGVHSTDLFVGAGLDFLDRRDAQRPFFLYIAMMAPHDPRTMPEKFLSLYDPKEIALPENFLHQHPYDTGALRVRDELLAQIPRQPDEIRRHIAEYYAMISHLDDAFGRLVAQLEALGLAENTIIVFTGDNGLALGQHGLMGKQNLYDHSLRVPLIFSGPGIPRGQRCEPLTYLFDIYPTLCDLCGLETPASVEGSSLVPCLHTTEQAQRENLYLAYCDTLRGIRHLDFKLIEYANGVTQLFNLVNDPYEKDNLVDNPENSTTLTELRQQLCRLRDEWDDRQHPQGARFWNQRSDLSL